MISKINNIFIIVTLFITLCSTMNIYGTEAASKLRGARGAINNPGKVRTLAESGNGWCPENIPDSNASCELTGIQAGDCYYNPLGKLIMSSVYNTVPDSKDDKDDEWAPSMVAPADSRLCVCIEGILTC